MTKFVTPLPVGSDVNCWHSIPGTVVDLISQGNYSEAKAIFMSLRHSKNETSKLRRIWASLLKSTR